MLTWLLALALAQDAVPEPTLEIGPIAFTASIDGPGPDLVLDECTARTTAPPLATRSAPPDGRVVLEVRFRRGKVSLVTVTESAPGMDWITPCLKRELAAVEWDIRKGTAEVPVTITTEPIPEPEPAPEPEPEPTPAVEPEPVE